MQRVLQPVHVLNDELFAAALRRHPLHAGDVVVAGIARDCDPAGLSPARAHDADSTRRIRLSRFRILHGDREGVQRVGHVVEQEIADAARVELPVRDRLAVGVPAPAILQPQLFFVDPIECAVDRGARAVARQLRDRAAADVLDVDVVLAVADPAHPAAIGRKLREHQRRRRAGAAQLLERPAGEIEDPVVAACIGAPDLLRVREDQQPPAIGRPRVLFDVEWRRSAGRHEPRRRHQNRLEAGFGVVAHDVPAGFPAGGRLEHRIADAIGEPAERGERAAAELLRAEDAIDGEEARVAGGALGSQIAAQRGSEKNERIDTTLHRSGSD